MPLTNGVDSDVPKEIVDEIKKTFVFRDGNVYNKKTGRQLKRYSHAPPPLPPYNFHLYFKLKGRVIDYDWASKNLILP
tara:strand:+ start:544 stop:777 length:234 start_codon:yes stop_codon:yes gene_type:complete